MGEWAIDVSKYPGILYFTLSGAFTLKQVESFLAAHNNAVDGFCGQPYRVLGDIRELRPLSQECAELLGRAKLHSAERANFEGSAVLVKTKFANMQHQRTSVAAGLADTELATEDEAEAWRHLKNVQRSTRKP